jgi:hypothetical protein
MIIAKIEAFPLRIPFRPGNKSAAAAWGGKDLPAADSLLVKSADLSADVISSSVIRQI